MDNQKIIIDLYEGGYGLTIRIGIDSKRDLVRFRDILESLENAEQKQILFKNTEEFAITGFESLWMKVLPLSEEDEKSVKIYGKKIYWEHTPEGWLKCKGLIDGILDSNHPCHQYLSEEGVDDVVVEVAYLGG